MIGMTTLRTAFVATTLAVSGLTLAQPAVAADSAAAPAKKVATTQEISQRMQTTAQRSPEAFGMLLFSVWDPQGVKSTHGGTTVLTPTVFMEHESMLNLMFANVGPDHRLERVSAKIEGERIHMAFDRVLTAGGEKVIMPTTMDFTVRDGLIREWVIVTTKEGDAALGKLMRSKAP